MITQSRDAYLETTNAVVEAARATPGCVDFALSPDLIDDERINVFEHWETIESLEQFRENGPSGDQQAVITAAHVEQHEITTTIRRI